MPSTPPMAAPDRDGKRRGYNAVMTEAQQVQYDRFIAAGFDPEDAARMVELGAWLGTQDVSEQAVIDIERYRRERDARTEQNVALTVNPK